MGFLFPSCKIGEPRWLQKGMHVILGESMAQVMQVKNESYSIKARAM